MSTVEISNADKLVHDKALNLDNGDTVIKQKLTVTGTSAFNDNITLSTGKTINNVDIGTLNTDVTSLKTTVGGMGSAVSGDFTGKSLSGAKDITASGTGTFSTIKTSAIDINGNITSTTGPKYITADAASVMLSNGLAAGNANYAFQKFDGTTGDITIKPGTNKSVVFGDISIKNNSINGIGVLNTTGQIVSGGTITGDNIRSNTNVDVGLLGKVTFNGTPVLGAYDITYGNTKLNSSSLNVPTITSTTIANTGALSNTGALKVGSNKWLINEVVDANKVPRLCFGSESSAGTQTYWACLNNQGNLEKYNSSFKV